MFTFVLDFLRKIQGIDVNARISDVIDWSVALRVRLVSVSSPRMFGVAMTPRCPGSRQTNISD